MNDLVAQVLKAIEEIKKTSKGESLSTKEQEVLFLASLLEEEK
jgi:cell division protein YceG involved in septum cleavage